MPTVLAAPVTRQPDRPSAVPQVPTTPSFRLDPTAPMLADATFRDDVQSRIAMGRVGQLQDVMGSVVFLCSDASALVTGSALMVDGGWTAA